jgi:ribosome-binding factor A
MTRGTKPPGQRQLRVGEEIRHALANIFERGDLRDPDLAGRPLTVTEVRISPDLRNATVYVIPLGGGDATSLLAGLKRSRSFLRHELARAVELRMVPDLWFEADKSFDRMSRIEAILAKPEVRRDVEAAGHEDGEDGA